MPDGDRAARVALVTVVLDDDGVLLEGLADRVDGIVVAAMGAGHVPQRLAEPLGELAARRAGRPGVPHRRRVSVLHATYGFVGSESDSLRRGLISAGYLDGPKSRDSADESVGSRRDGATRSGPRSLSRVVMPGAEHWPW